MIWNNNDYTYSHNRFYADDEYSIEEDDRDLYGYQEDEHVPDISEVSFAQYSELITAPALIFSFQKDDSGRNYIAITTHRQADNDCAK